MGILLDSSILIAAERKQFDLPVFLKAHENQEIAIGAITASELLHGCERARSESQKKNREQYVEGILARIPVVPFDVGQARIHARLWAQQVKAGELIGAHDLMIAATAMSIHFELATLNHEDFRRVPGLKMVDLNRGLRSDV